MVMSKHKSFTVTYLLAGLLGIALVAGSFGGYKAYTLNEALIAKTNEQAQTAMTLDDTQTKLADAQLVIEELNSEIEELTEDLDDTEKDLRREKDKNDEFEDQIDDLTGTVKDLDKLSKTDKELLQKYSKVYFLNENYEPSKLKQIDEDYILPGKDPMYFHADALTFLEDMIEDAEDDGIDLKIVSAYRSFDHQQALKGEFTQVYGDGANAFSADQGYSEHQLATTIDITDPATGGTYTSFKDTEAYAWLLDNAYRYGFVESYPEGNTYYVFEPWHWRFVGTDLAKDLDRADAHFYDWEQRKIDSYLLNIFD